MCFKGSHVEILNCDVIMPMKIVFILANSVDPDEMLPLCDISSGSSLFAKVPVSSIKNYRINELTVKVTILFLSLLHYMFKVNPN